MENAGRFNCGGHRKIGADFKCFLRRAADSPQRTRSLDNFLCEPKQLLAAFHVRRGTSYGHSTSTYLPLVLSQSGWTLPRPHGGTVLAMSILLRLRTSKAKPKVKIHKNRLAVSLPIVRSRHERTRSTVVLTRKTLRQLNDEGADKA